MCCLGACNSRPPNAWRLLGIKNGRVRRMRRWPARWGTSEQEPHQARPILRMQAESDLLETGPLLLLLFCHLELFIELARHNDYSHDNDAVAAVDDDLPVAHWNRQQADSAVKRIERTFFSLSPPLVTCQRYYEVSDAFWRLLWLEWRCSVRRLYAIKKQPQSSDLILPTY